MWLRRFFGNRTVTSHAATRATNEPRSQHLGPRRLQHEPLEERALLSLWSLQDAEPMSAPSALVNDALEVPEEVVTEMQAMVLTSPPPAGELPFGAGLNDSSEFMLGDVWVTVVLLESDGTTDANTEDWTAAEIAEVKTEIQEGLTWWEDTLAAQFPTSTHDLTFHADFTYADAPVATPYEPITHLSTEEYLWIDSFLGSVGYDTGATYRTDLAQWNNDQRIANDAHWAYSIIVVDSSADADGRFTDASGMFAYAYTGGPHLTMTYDNSNWGIEDMGQVLAHETGHIFYALDEYAGTSTYTNTAGYYNTQNLNASTGHPDPTSRVNSIMAEATLQNPAYLNHTSSPSSLAMIGWQDSDADGIFDLLDVPLDLIGTGNFDPVNGVYEFMGNSSVATLTNLNSEGNSADITTNTVDRIQYRLDGGAWTDGNAYASYNTPISLDVPVGAGMHDIEIRTLFAETGLTSNVFTDTFGIGVDYGDAPLPYPTLFTVSGASHTLSNGLFLGTTVDNDTDGQPDAGALGDDNDGSDDEDGVVFLSTLNQGGLAVVQVTASQPGLLDAWIDFGDDGTWHATDRVFNNATLVAGVNTLNFNVPVGATETTETFARFRVSTAGANSPLGLLPDGEVEDYAVAIETADVAPIIRATDPGGNGQDAGGADDVRLVRNGANVEVYFTDSGTPVLSRTFDYATLNSLTVEGSGDDDSLTLDFSGGDVVPLGGIFYDGNTSATGDSDLLTLEGGAFDTVTHNLDTPSDGSIVLSGVTDRVITYTGLEPIFDNTDAIARVLNYSIGDDTDVRLFDLDPADTTVQIEAPGSGETVNMQTGTMTSLQINLGTGNDILEIERLESGFFATIEVNGEDGNDQFVVDYSQGLVEELITFNGDAGVDTMKLTGDPLVLIGRTIYQAGATDESGFYVVNAGSGSETLIDFDGLVSIDDTTPATAYDVLLTDGVDEVQLVDGPMVDTFVTSEIGNLVGSTFAPVNFANKTNVTISGFDGTDGITLDNPNAAAGLTTLDLYGNELTDGTLNVDDDASDRFIPLETSAAVTIRAYGQGGDDLLRHNLIEGGDLSGLLGPIEFIGGPGNFDSIVLQDSNSAVADTVTLTSNTLTGAAPGVITYSSAESFFYESTSGDDTIDITSTNAGTDYLISGDGGSDTFTIGDADSLDAILGPITISGDSNGAAGTNTLNVDDSGTGNLDAATASITDVGVTAFTLLTGEIFSAPTTRLEGFAPETIAYFHADYSGGSFDGVVTSMALLNVTASTGADDIVVNDTTATDTTTVDAFQGDDQITIRGDGLSAANVFLGNLGDDRFVLNVTDNLGADAVYPLTGVQLEGNGHGAGSVFDQRDRLEINDLGAGTVRSLDWQYGAASGDGSAADGRLIGFAVPIDVNTMETVSYLGDAANDDFFDVSTPAGGIHQLTFAPNGPNSARVFLDGTPWTGPPADYYASLPGVAGGSLGPDLRVSGVETENGTLLSGGLDDQLFVYASSELNVEDDGNAVDGDGNIVVQSAGTLGRPSAYDEIDVSEARVRIINNGVEGLRANVSLGSFTQSTDTTDGLIVNSGFEAVPNAAGEADLISAALSYDDGTGGFPIRINGGNPIPAFQPDGDHLEVIADGEINVFSDQAVPPVVSITSTNATGDLAFPLRFSSIEDVVLTPGINSQTVNLIGDNNNPALDQDDVYVIVGTDIDSTLGAIPGAQGAFQPDADGDNEFTLEINGSAPIGFRNVTQINAFGDEQPLVPDALDDIDTLDITPYADDTPQGWGIDVSFEAGNPDPDTSAAQDALIVRGVAGVSEAFEIVPSGSGAGQVVVNNASSDTPITLIDYISTTNIEIDGNDGLAGDADTLTLFGTDVDDQVTVDLAAVGGSMIEVANGTGLLYTIDPPLTFATLDFVLGDGDDLVDFTPGVGVQAYFDGGSPLGTIHSVGDTINLLPGAINYTYQPGPTPDSGTFLFDAADSVSFENFEQVQVNGVSISPILPDRFEPNDLVTSATLLGSLPKTTLRDLTLHEETPGTINEDYLQITAADTGMLLINAFFTHADGDVNIEVLDANGVLVTDASSISVDDNEQIAIPVVSQERYYLHVFSADARATRYELEIENFMAPTPTDVFIYSGDDTGRYNLDNVTNEEQPQLLIQAGLAHFADAGVPILSAADVANNLPGAAVEVFINGDWAGYANPLGLSNQLFSFDVPAGSFVSDIEVGFPADTDAFGFMNLVSASVHLFDGQDTPADAYANLSNATLVTYDPNPPGLPGIPSLIDSSDSGVLGDNVTNIQQPKFVGEAEVNALVRVYADEQLIGEAVVGSDATNGTLGDGLGAWEVTGESLTDGLHLIKAELEDLAGNVTDRRLSPTLSLTIDTFAPQRPTLDLENADDTGSSSLDNVSFGDPRFARPAGDGVLDFIVTADAGVTVDIKDGNTVIATYPVGSGLLNIDFVDNQATYGIPAEGTHLLSAESLDASGNRSAQSEELAVTVDFTPPAQPAIALAGYSDSGIVGDGLTNVNPPAFIGTGEPNTIVRIFDEGALAGVSDDVLVGVGVVGSDETDGVLGNNLGRWEVTVEPLADGTYSFKAELEDLAGNVTDRAVSPVLPLTIDSLTPQRPTLDLVNVDDTGSSNLDNVTFGDPRFARPAGDGVLDFIVTADADVTTVDIKDGNTVIATYLVGSGLLNIDFVDNQATYGIPAEGTHLLSAESFDASGNRSAQSEELAVTIDFTPPVQPVLIALAGYSDSGIVGDGLTNVNPPAFIGTGEPNAIVRIFDEGALVGISDDVLVGVGIVGSDETDGILGNNLGRWEVTVEPLADDAYSFKVELEDLAGNITNRVNSPMVNVQINTIGPQRPTLDLENADDTGSSDLDNVTIGGLVGFPLTQSEGILDFIVTADAGVTTVDVKDGNTVIATYIAGTGPLTINFVNNETLFGIPAEGTHLLSAESFDASGNRSAQSEELAVTVDFTPPATDPNSFTINLADYSDSGVLGDWSTNVNPPAFQGIGEANALVRLYANGLLVGEGVVQSDESDGDPTDGLGIWEVTIEPLGNGLFNITGQLEDLAGNVTVRVSPDPTGLLTIDTTTPQRPTIDLVGPDVVDNDVNGVVPIDSDTGMSTSDNITRGYQQLFGSDAASVQVRLSGDPGSTLWIKDGNDVIRTEVMPTPAMGNPAGFLFVSLTLDEDPHPLSVEAFDVNGNRSDQSEVLLVTVDITDPLAPSTPDLQVDSDSGLYDDDDVTNIDTPTFTGTGEPNSLVRIYAENWDTMLRQLVGEGRVGSDESDGISSNELGIWEITTIPLDDGVYDVTTELEDSSGNISNPSTALVVEIDTLQPNTPFLDLLAQDDTGRRDNDNITQVRNPLFSATTEDPNDDLHRNEENFIYRIFDRPEEWVEELRYDSLEVTPYTLLMEDQLIMTLDLMTDGIHNLKLEVEDRAGNISEDYLLDVWVDTSPYLGIDFLYSGSDTGVPGFSLTQGDRITSESIPDFSGTAEPGSLVIMTLDGTSQLPGTYTGTDGNWQIESEQILVDGQHEAAFTYEDAAGNQITSEPVFFFIDTQGPRITNLTQGTVSVDGNFRVDGTTSLFEPKPAGGPDEMISSLVISFSDAPDRTLLFSYDAVFQALALEEGNYQVAGDANGNIPILDVVVYSNDPGPGATTAQYELVFHRAGADGIWNTNDDEGAPLPDDRFTLTVSDTLADPAGNTLDGDSGAGAPFEGQNIPANTLPIFPTGDGEPGGQFVGRFTVDSRPELGTWGAGSVWIDTNGNFTFDSDNPDYSNRDITYTQGYASDDVFAGNFAATGAAADGFDKLAAYGRVNGSYRWLIDLDNDGAPDLNIDDPSNINGLPISGRFDGNNNNGDEVGLVEVALNPTRTIWHFDTNHNFQIDPGDYTLTSQMQGHAAVGDIDGDNLDDLVTWKDDTFYVDLAEENVPLSWDGVADHSFTFGFIGLRERPVVHDMDGDGFDDLGLWVPDRSGLAPEEQGEWYFLVSGGASVLDRIEISGDTGNPIIEYRPTPFGNDFTAQFGDEYAVPIVGNFDPPLADPVAFPPKQTILLFGTDDDDVLQIQAGATPDAWTIELNGVIQQIGSANAIDFQGGAGHDTVTLIGTDAADAAEIWSDRAILTSDTYEVSVSQMEQITVDGAGGEDSLVMHDTVDDDTLVIRTGRVSLAGPEVSILAKRFENVNTLADLGGHDTARFYDSPGNDHMVISPEFGQMTGEGFSHRAQFFDIILSYASAGGIDSAEMYDSPEDDSVVTTPIWSRIHNDDFAGRVKFFDTVSIFANAGGYDVAKMKDSPGDDTFVGQYNESTFSGDGFYTHVEFFDAVNVDARRGGYDTARLNDSPSDDQFIGRDWYSELTGDGYSIRAKLFDGVYTYADKGGFDMARLVGSAGDDTLIAQTDVVLLYGDKFLNRAKYFDTVQVAGRDGIDTAEIRDAVIEEQSVAPIMARGAAWQTSWLNQFELIQQKNQQSEGGRQDIDAVDQIFRAFWD